MQSFIFSLGIETVQFKMDVQTIEIDKGLGFIESQSVRNQRLDALAIENMIEVIEEILEQLKLDYKTQRIAQISDAYLQQLSHLFFQNARVIDRIKLEHAFNEFVERMEYYAEQAGFDFKLFAYFVFVREMMHHLNVVEIKLLN
ncbi:hypothetical protein [Acinetobacter bouvetii]|uniref:Uncharacterized protein n=1 Tax=Acinetobacter bouvetii TaxID=202951 RepID=A0A811GC46_9GAMM|nr:hypothetical protein [Acinetobacter bouvetii]CAB1216060.1 hypothetical protein SFB21_1850 [Acinetobacter bouvetii]